MIGETAADTGAQLRAAIDTYLYSLEDALQPIEQRVGDQIAGSLDTIHGNVVNAATGIFEKIDAALGDDIEASLVMPAAASRIESALSAQVSEAEKTIAAVADRVSATIGDQINLSLPSATDALSALAQILSDLVGGLLGSLTDTGELWQSAADVIGKALDEHKDPIGGIVSYVLGIIIKNADNNWGPTIAASEQAASITGPNVPPRPKAVEEWIEGSRNSPRIVQALYNSAAQIIGLIGILNARNASYLSGVTQAANYEGMTAPLTSSELAALTRQEDVTRDWASDEARRTGFSQEFFDLKMKLQRSFLTPDQMIDLWRRTGSDTALQDLPKLGYNEVDIQRLKDLALAVASPADIVRFLARDVFDPAAIQAGGLDADYEQKYNEHFFNAAGVTKDLGKLYWMAHWSLPSPTMGYEMMHRGFITQAQLEELLKLADYAPGWVQHLVDIAYNVPGRIDVRRMWQAGIITTHEELVKRHQDMGYSPADAETLAQFVERTAEQAKERDAERTRAPLVQAIVHSFVSGTMSEEDAQAALVGIGMTGDGAAFRLKAGEYERERDKADRIRKAIGREYVRGYLDDAGVSSRLSGYGFGSAEISSLLDSWHLDRELAEETEAQRHEKDLTKSEIIAAFHDRLQDKETTIRNLVSLGYDAQESATLVAIEESKQQQADNRAAEQAIHTQYVNRRMSPDEATNALLGFGLSDTRVAALMSRWNVEREEKRPDITSAQLERLIMRGLIEVPDAKSRLSVLGYTDADADLILRLWGSDMAVQQAQIDEKVREFNIREQRLSSQGDRRLDLTSRAQDLVMQRFTESQQSLQERFTATQQQQRELQQQRLDSSATLQSERIAAQTARDAASFEARRQIQANQIEAANARLDKQIEEKQRAQQAALEDRATARAQAATLQQQRIAATNAAQQRQIEAAAKRQQATIEAADRRAAQHEQAVIDLTNQRQQNALQLVSVRADIQQARDIRLNAEQIAKETRTESARIRQENRSQARKDITSATVASQQAQLQSLQLQQASAVAEINARFAALQAQQATDRAQAALDLRNNAIQSLTANTPATQLLDSVGM